MATPLQADTPETECLNKNKKPQLKIRGIINFRPTTEMNKSH